MIGGFNAHVVVCTSNRNDLRRTGFANQEDQQRCETGCRNMEGAPPTLIGPCAAAASRPSQLCDIRMGLLGRDKQRMRTPATQHRPAMMATPASRRKPLDVASNLMATLEQFTVPKLKSGGSTATATKVQPEAANLSLSRPAADQPASDAGASSAATAILHTSDAAAVSVDSVHPDPEQAEPEQVAAMTQRLTTAARSPAPAPQQLSDTAELSAMSGAPRMQAATAADCLACSPSSVTPVGSAQDADSHNMQLGAPRWATQAGSKLRTVPSSSVSEQPLKEPHNTLQRTVTHPPAGGRSTSKTSPRQDDADEVRIILVQTLDRCTHTRQMLVIPTNAAWMWVLM